MRRFAKDGQRIVYSSDSEHTVESNKEDYPFVEFFKDADVVIFDAQYELFDAIDTKASWGGPSPSRERSRGGGAVAKHGVRARAVRVLRSRARTVR